MLNQKPENLFNSIGQLLGEEKLVKPSVLIPQSKVNLTNNFGIFYQFLTA